MAQLLRLPLLLLAALAVTLAVGSSRQVGMVGGFSDADPQEKGVQLALDYAISEYNKASNDAFHSRALRVVRARKQVVAGMNYVLDVELGRTTCTKSQPNLANCPFHDQPHLKKVLCSFHIYSIPWMNKISLTHSNCESA